MALPKTVTKVTKDGIEFTSNVDRIQYTIQELTRAALRDVAKLIRKRLLVKLRMLPGMKKSKRLYRSTQYWVRRRESDLQIGFKHDSWYGARSELGTHGQPARNILRQTIYENIDEIRLIQGKYLSAIGAGDSALGLIEDVEHKGNEDGED